MALSDKTRAAVEKLLKICKEDDEKPKFVHWLHELMREYEELESENARLKSRPMTADEEQIHDWYDWVRNL